MATFSTPSRRLLNSSYASTMSVEREAVGDQRQRVEPARSATVAISRPHPLLAARAERGDDAVVAEAGRERVVGHLELARVDAQARQRAARPQAAQRVLEGPLGAQRLDGHVGAAAGQALHLGDDVDLGEVERRRRRPCAGHRQADRVAVDADDQRRRPSASRRRSRTGRSDPARTRRRRRRCGPRPTRRH